MSRHQTLTKVGDPLTLSVIIPSGMSMRMNEQGHWVIIMEPITFTDAATGRTFTVTGPHDITVDGQPLAA